MLWNGIKRYLSVCVIVGLCLITGFAYAENDDHNRSAQIIVTAIYAGDYDAAFDVTIGVTDAEFRKIYDDAREDIAGTEGITLIRVSDMDTVVLGAVAELVIYDLVADTANFEVHLALDERSGKVGYFALMPAGKGVLSEYEFTDYEAYEQALGAAAGPSDYRPTALSWVMVVYSVAVIVFVVIMIVDCIRHKVKRRWLWIPVILLASVAVNINMVGDMLNFTFTLGIIVANSVFGAASTGFAMRVLIPVGAIVYLCLRKKLIKKADTSAAADQVKTEE